MVSMLTAKLDHTIKIDNICILYTSSTSFTALMVVFDLFNHYVMCDRLPKTHVCVFIVFGDTVFKCSVVSCHIIIGEAVTWASTGQQKYWLQLPLTL